MPFDINTAYNLCVQACLDNIIGYSQPQRTTIQLGVNYRTYCDCSSLMAWCCYNAGAWNSNPWFTTDNERQYLEAAGFTRFPANSVQWSAGDILTRSENYNPRGHTEMVYQAAGIGGYTMGSHSKYLSDGSERPFPDQVSINTFLTNVADWDWIYKSGGTVTGIYSWTQNETNTYGALTSDEIYANAILTYFELSNMGFSAAAAAGVMGNIEHEGQFNPAQWQGGFPVGSWYDSNCGYGMFQYTPPHKYYQDWAAGQGVDINDADSNGPLQVRWLDAHPSQFAGTSPYMVGNPHYGISYNDFKLLTDPADASNVWLRA